MNPNDAINRLIRAKAGYARPEPEAEAETKPENHGSADGGAGTNSKPRPSGNMVMNKTIRDVWLNTRKGRK